MSSHIVATVDEVRPGERKIVEIAGREIGLFNIDGRFYAVRNRCPHQAGPLCEGRVGAELTSSGPGDYRYEREGEILRCPWHQWEFDLRTGQSWFDPARVRVRTYKIRIESGEALAAEHASLDHSRHDTSSGRDTEPNDQPQHGHVPGPYKAEIYPVTIQHRYVIVDIDR